MKYRKKPVVIEAEQFVPWNEVPQGICMCNEAMWLRDNPAGVVSPHIHTLEGIHKVEFYDWIVTGVQGEQYPVKPDIFKATYEPMEAPDA